MESIIVVIAIGLMGIIVIVGLKKLSNEIKDNSVELFNNGLKLRKIDTRLEYSRKRELKILKRLKGGKK